MEGSFHLQMYFKLVFSSGKQPACLAANWTWILIAVTVGRFSATLRFPSWDGSGLHTAPTLEIWFLPSNVWAFYSMPESHNLAATCRCVYVHTQIILFKNTYLKIHSFMLTILQYGVLKKPLCSLKTAPFTLHSIFTPSLVLPALDPGLEQSLIPLD